MTALKQYEKLEATALWRETLATQRREVYVSFGDTSLMIRDQNDAPLSHWSLPAVERLNPGIRPAIYAPHLDASETLEIEDATMIGAIEKIRSAIKRRGPHPGRLRLAVLIAVTALVAVLGVFWLPNALARHTVRVVPFETRKDIGLAIVNHITTLTGSRCTSGTGENALRTLEKRLGVAPRGRVLILRDGLAKSANLPGELILLNKILIEDHEVVEVAAGYVLLERTRATMDDPLAKLLQHAGGLASFRLLTTGAIDAASLKAYARHILTHNDTRPPDDALLSKFATAGFSSAAFAYEIDISGETTLTLIEADPLRNQSYAPLLSDSDWVGLQAICGG